MKEQLKRRAVGNPTPQKPDDSEPSLERQEELREAYEANVAAGSPPYSRVEIHTRGELSWIFRERGWSGSVFSSNTPDLREVILNKANLSGMYLYFVNLRGADLIQAELNGTWMNWADVSDADFEGAGLEGGHLSEATLVRTRLSGASLVGADLFGADMRGATVVEAHLNGARLVEANMAGAIFENTDLNGANLRLVRMDATTILRDCAWDSGIKVADVAWNGVQLARLDWKALQIVGDETLALKRRDADGNEKDAATRLAEYEAAVRAYRLLAVALRGQGLNDHADRFAYRGQLLQRQVLFRQGHGGQWFFSLLLDRLSGYGYRLRRILITYILTLLVFAAAFYAVGLWQGPVLAPQQAFLVSVTAVHGRVFFEQFGLNSLLSWVAAIESVVGIVIEGVFVAMLVQRFFAR